MFQTVSGAASSCINGPMTVKRCPRGGSSSGTNGDSERADGALPRSAVAAAKRAAADGIAHPTDTEIAVLHERVLIGHPAAVEALVERLLPLLVTLVRRTCPKAPEDFVMNAVEDALMEYSRRPAGFDRGRGVPLVMFLRLAALRNMSNLIRAESRRRARERKLAEEATPAEWPMPLDPATASNDALADIVQTALVALDPDEQAVAALWLQGERRTAPLARVLRIDHLPIDEQRRGLKRLKDRLRNRVKRVLSHVKRR